MRPIQTARGFGAEIRRARKDRGLTQVQLAELAGVGRPWLSELETGKPTAEIGRALAVLDALELSVAFVASPDPGPGVTNLDELVDGAPS